MNNDKTLASLVDTISQCRICTGSLPLGPRPVLRASSRARILVAGQAPGIRVHRSGIPFDDPSGNRLRAWMGVSREIFYDSERIAIVPMGFCYPGSATHGDLPPRKECAVNWHPQLLPLLAQPRLTLAIGSYAQRYHLAGRCYPSLTETVAHWQDYLPAIIPLPHPSPRNNIWLKRNPWFENELLPELGRLVAAHLFATSSRAQEPGL